MIRFSHTLIKSIDSRLSSCKAVAIYKSSTICGKILCEQPGTITSMEVNVERLRELRREHVLSLRELEEKSGVSYNTIWRIEANRQGAHPRTIRKLAEALGVDPKELIRGES